MNSSTFPPLPEQEATNRHSSRPPLSARAFLSELAVPQFSPEQVQQYLTEIKPIVWSLMKNGNLSELIYNLAINPKLFPLPHQSELIDSIAQYSSQVNYLGTTSFEEQSNPDQSGVFPNLGKKWLEVLRSQALIHLSHGYQEKFFQTAKVELLLSILVCQVHADEVLAEDLVNLLPERQLQELEEVRNVHELVKNVRQKRTLEQIIPPEKELLLNHYIKSIENFEVIFEAIFNAHLLPDQQS